MSVEESAECRDGGLDYSEPVAKRTRSASKKLLEPEEPKVEDSSTMEPTILDYLNDDCWRVILDYVKLRDLALSERVSRRWRCVVQRYLQGIRLNLRSSFYLYESLIPLTRPRMLVVPLDCFVSAVKKFGRTVVAADCMRANVLRALSKHCPDIEEIRIQEAQYHSLKTKIVPFNNVKRISFMAVNNFKDDHIAKFLGYTTLEELEVNDNHKMTGACLSELKADLKTLEIQSCRAFNIYNLISVEHLSELKKLELNCNPLGTLENLHKLIEKTPKLEYLGLVWYEYTSYIGALVEAICGLSMLRHLNLFSNNSVTDKWLEAVGNLCRHLQTVSVGDCEDVTAVGVVALCRGAGRTLVALDASCNEYITEEDVVRCISYCPKLEILNVQYSSLVARALPGVAAAVRGAGRRARPLRLYLSRLAYQTVDVPPTPPIESCPDLIVDFSHYSFKCGDLSEQHSGLEH